MLAMTTQIFLTCLLVYITVLMLSVILAAYLKLNPGSEWEISQLK